MRKNRAYFTRKNIFTLFFLLLQIFVPVFPVQADVTNWNEFSSSLNQSFSGQHVLSQKNISALIISILVIALLSVVFYLYLQKEKKRQALSKQRYQEIRKARIARSSEQQKRRWFRLKTRAEFKWIPAPLGSEIDEKEYQTDRLLDISGGGLSFSTADIIEPGDEIAILLDVRGKNALSLKAEVVRIVKADNPEEELSTVSVQFTNLSNRDEDRLVSWIIERQRNTIQEEEQEEEREEAKQEKQQQDNKESGQEIQD